MPDRRPALGFAGLLVPVVAGFLAGAAVRPALARALDARRRGPAVLVARPSAAGCSAGLLLGLLAGPPREAPARDGSSTSAPIPVAVGLAAALEFAVAIGIGLGLESAASAAAPRGGSVRPRADRLRHVLRLVVLISGGGSNLRALLDASRRRRVPGARRRDRSRPRRRRGSPTRRSSASRASSFRSARSTRREAWGDELLDADPAVGGRPRHPVRLHAPAAAARGRRALARRCSTRIPAYLPEFPGAHAVRDALAAGATETGASVIVVDNGVDSGPIVAQRRIPVLPGDTEARPARAHQARRTRAARAGRARHRERRTPRR